MYFNARLTVYYVCGVYLPSVVIGLKWNCIILILSVYTNFHCHVQKISLSLSSLASLLSFSLSSFFIVVLFAYLNWSESDFSKSEKSDDNRGAMFIQRNYTNTQTIDFNGNFYIIFRIFSLALTFLLCRRCCWTLCVWALLFILSEEKIISKVFRTDNSSTRVVNNNIVKKK